MTLGSIPESLVLSSDVPFKMTIHALSPRPLNSYITHCHFLWALTVTVIIDTHIEQMGKHLYLTYNVRLVSEHLEMLG